MRKLVVVLAVLLTVVFGIIALKDSKPVIKKTTTKVAFETEASTTVEETAKASKKTKKYTEPAPTEPSEAETTPTEEDYFPFPTDESGEPIYTIEPPYLGQEQTEEPIYTIEPPEFNEDPTVTAPIYTFESDELLRGEPSEKYVA